MKWLSKSPAEWAEIRQKRLETRRKNAKIRAEIEQKLQAKLQEQQA
jgi:hypothetical protein